MKLLRRLDEQFWCMTMDTYSACHSLSALLMNLAFSMYFFTVASNANTYTSDPVLTRKVYYPFGFLYIIPIPFYAYGFSGVIRQSERILQIYNYFNYANTVVHALFFLIMGICLMTVDLVGEGIGSLICGVIYTVLHYFNILVNYSHIEYLIEEKNRKPLPVFQMPENPKPHIPIPQPAEGEDETDKQEDKEQDKEEDPLNIV